MSVRGQTVPQGSQMSVNTTKTGSPNFSYDEKQWWEFEVRIYPRWDASNFIPADVAHFVIFAITLLPQFSFFCGS